LSQLLGANRRYIEQHLPHIGQLVRPDIEAVIRESEVLVVGLSGEAVTTALGRFTRPDQHVVDLVGLPRSVALAATVDGLCW
jgi:GDP-mannose 6-dehydrogenase